MIQPIRYRGKSIEINEWVFGFYLEHDGQAYIISDEYPDAIPIKPETAGQLIGISDRVDHPIFTGDIINAYPWEGDNVSKTRRAVILWSAINGAPGFFFFCDFKKDSNPIDDESYGTIGFLSMPYIEVVGNIFDNPYLLQNI